MKVLYVSMFISINKFLCIINIDLHCQQSFVDCLLIIAPIFFISTRYFLLFDDLHSRHFSHSHHAFVAAARKNAPVFFNFPLKSIDRDTRFFSANYLQHVATKSFPQNLLLLVVDRQTHFICCRRHRFMLFLALFGPKREIFNKSKVILTFYD